MLFYAKMWYIYPKHYPPRAFSKGMKNCIEIQRVQNFQHIMFEIHGMQKALFIPGQGLVGRVKQLKAPLPLPLETELVWTVQPEGGSCSHPFIFSVLSHFARHWASFKLPNFKVPVSWSLPSQSKQWPWDLVHFTASIKSLQIDYVSLIDC